MIDEKYKDVAQTFKTGWDAAGRDGVVSPALKKALEETHGIHPDQADRFMADTLDARRHHKAAPKPEDYARPVVLPFAKPAIE